MLHLSIYIRSAPDLKSSVVLADNKVDNKSKNNYNMKEFFSGLGIAGCCFDFGFHHRFHDRNGTQFCSVDGRSKQCRKCK